MNYTRLPLENYVTLLGQPGRTALVTLPAGSSNDPFIKGFAQTLEVEPGFFVQIVDYTALQAVELIPSEGTTILAERRVFSAYIFSPRVLQFCTGPERPFRTTTLERLTVSFTEDIFITARLEKGENLKLVLLAFTPAWLQQQTHNAEPLLLRDAVFFQIDHSFFHPRQAAVSEMVYAHEFFSLILERKSLFLIKGYAYFFISKAFENSRDQQPAAQEALVDLKQVVIQVENRIMSSLRSAIPSISELAKVHYTSESTLKRHFKSVFGKNIYQYYLEKKMELGHRLLTEKGWGITKTADYLGYRNTCHFTNLFKKVYGCVPSQARRMGLSGKAEHFG